MHTRRRLIAGLVLYWLLVGGHFSFGQTSWNGAQDDWNTAIKWSNGIPDFTKDALVDNGGRPYINTAGNAATLTLGKDNSGSVGLPAGASVLTAPGLTLGLNANGSGYIGMQLGTLKTSVFNIGVKGIGVVDQLDGEVNGAGALPPMIALGTDTGGQGFYNLSKGTLNAVSLSLGDATGGIGTFAQTGGTLKVTSTDLQIGRNGKGVYTMSDGAIEVNRIMYVGQFGNGKFTQSGGSVSVPGRLVVAGDVNTATTGTGTLRIIADGSTPQSFKVGEIAYVFTNGTLDLYGKSVFSCDNLSVQGGTVSGNGTIGPNANAAADVTVTLGSLDPQSLDAVTGTLTIVGNFVEKGGAYKVDIGGKNAGEYDVLAVNGAVGFINNPKLDVNLVNDFVPQLGDAFKIITGQMGQVGFGVTNLPALTDGLSWRLEKNATDFTLRVVPEPSICCLLWVTVIPLATCGRRKSAGHRKHKLLQPRLDFASGRHTN